MVPKPDDIPLCAERLALARCTLANIQAISRAYMEPKGFGTADMGIFLIGIAVFIGMAEGRPMSANKVSQFLGIPRATVARKLAQMRERGMVEIKGNRVFIPLDRLASPEAIASTHERLALVATTYAGLTKMDT
jgi:biotin operon repressor